MKFHKKPSAAFSLSRPARVYSTKRTNIYDENPIDSASFYDSIQTIPGEMHEAFRWIPPSPFLLTEIKDMARRLARVSEWDAARFLKCFGASSVNDLERKLSGCGAPFITSCARRAFGSIHPITAKQIGLSDAA